VPSHCAQAVLGTLENGVVEYNETTGTYIVHNFPGYTLSPGDLVDITANDGTHFRSTVVEIPATLPALMNLTVASSWMQHLNYTDYVNIDIPPNSTLYLHYSGVQGWHEYLPGLWGGCANTSVFQWNGTNSWTYDEQWDFNANGSTKIIANNTSDWHYKRIHCDDPLGFDLTFNLVYGSGGTTSPGNPGDFALVSLGAEDGFSCEFGNIVAPDHSFIFQPSAQYLNFPSRLGTDGVQNLTIQFESYDNIFWSDMRLMIDLVNITQPGTLNLYIPDATVPNTSVQINAGDTACFFNPGGIMAPGIHTMILSATGGLSMGIDCFTFVSRTGAPANKTLNVTVLLEGLYAGGGMMNQAWDEFGPHFPAGIADQVEVELHNAVDYPTIEYSTGLVDLTTGGHIGVNIPAAFSGSYWITIKNRNHILTVSANPVSFAGSTIDYDFTTAASQAFGDNQKYEGGKASGGYYVIYAGDVNQDGIVDSGDMNAEDNALTAIAFGYLPEDVTGDGFVDSSDMNMVDNNSTAVIMAYTP
jgi:hypothetical protein